MNKASGEWATQYGSRPMAHSSSLKAYFPCFKFRGRDDFIFLISDVSAETEVPHIVPIDAIVPTIFPGTCLLLGSGKGEVGSFSARLLTDHWRFDRLCI